jgi:predicted TIM-barrel fold metal-dependent hydrolase
MIIDVHCHLGREDTAGVELTEDDLLRTMDECGIDVALVQPYAGTYYPERVHDRIARMAASNPGRIYGVVNYGPLRGPEAYDREVTRCVQDLGFVGIKLDPLIHGCSASSVAGAMAFELASRLSVPLEIHTGVGTPTALPITILAPARRFPEVTVIMVHSGFITYTEEALVVGRECPNVYFETTWLAPLHAQPFLREFGAQRLVYASDHPTQAALELAKFRQLGLAGHDLELVLSGNAARLFNLPG